MEFNVGDPIKMSLKKIIEFTGNKTPTWYREKTYIITKITSELDMKNNKIVQLDDTILDEKNDINSNKISSGFIELDLKEQRKRKLHDIYLHQNI